MYQWLCREKTMVKTVYPQRKHAADLQTDSCNTPASCYVLKLALVWCRYAVMGHEPGAMLLLAVAQQALMQLDSFSPQEITNMVGCSPQGSSAVCYSGRSFALVLFRSFLHCKATQTSAEHTPSHLCQSAAACCMCQMNFATAKGL